MIPLWPLPESHMVPTRWCLVFLISLLRPQDSSAQTLLEKPPQIVKDLPQKMTLKEGPLNRFVLECRGDAEPAPNYHWYKNNELLTLERLAEQEIKEVSDEEHSQLDFSKPSAEHEGYYHCEAENSLGLAKSSVTHVAPAFHTSPLDTSPPQFLEAPKTELQSLGGKVELPCRAKGSPEPRITWTKNGQILPTETETLVIPSLAQGDVANYACNASNIAGYEYKNVIVNILSMTPRIKEGPKDQHVGSKGSNVTLKCVAEGYPKPVITWSKEGQQIRESDKFHVDPDTGDLTVTDADTSDNGRYECLAQSNLGDDAADGELIVKTITTIVEGPRDRTETMDDSIVMKCEVVADLSLDLDVTWKKDNLDFGQPGFEKNERISQEEDHSLLIKNLTFEDSGTYTCVARTSLHMATESGLLTVVGVEPLLDPLDYSEKLLLEGSTFSFPCSLTQGVPAPRVTWYQDGQEVDRDRVRVEEDNTLVLGPVTNNDIGEYICKVSNSEGDDSLSVEVLVSAGTEVVSPSLHVDLESQLGKDVSFPCDVNLDGILGDKYDVVWWKDEEELVDVILPPNIIAVETSDIEPVVVPCQDKDSKHRLYQLTNNSLVVCNLQHADVGSYQCQVSTKLEKNIRSSYSSVYVRQTFPWWILVIIISVLLLALILCIVCYCRRKKQGKGYYGMDIENGAVHNRSDIYYTTEDNESIMDEVDQSMLEKQNGKTPIFTPRTIRRLARVDKSIGSIGSLLDDDEYLDKGYDEDGSFRERYAE